MTKRSDYRAALESLPPEKWVAYLNAESRHRITASFRGMDHQSRRDEQFRVLRQELGNCWSVAIAAAPVEGFGRLEKWAGIDDKDVRWIVREILKKARLVKADPAAARRVAAVLERAGK